MHVLTIWNSKFYYLWSKLLKDFVQLLLHFAGKVLSLLIGLPFCCFTGSSPNCHESQANFMFCGTGAVISFLFAKCLKVICLLVILFKIDILEEPSPKSANLYLR